MRALITGVSGFVGRRLAARLLAAGDTVAGFYVGERPELEGADLFEADVLDREAIVTGVSRAAPDVVFHLAGLSHVGDSWRAMGEYFRVNVLGTEVLLEAAAGRRVVLASSGEVYGPVVASEQPIRENRLPDPRTPYALTKAAAERLAIGAGAIIVRAFNLVGAGQARRFALPTFAAQLAAIARGEREPVLAVGNLEARRDFLHIDDAVAGFRRVAAQGAAGEIYNLGSGEAVSIREALDRLLALSGVDARLAVDPERVRPVDLPLLRADTARLRALGWRLERTLDEALSELWSEAASGVGPALPGVASPGGDRSR